MMILLVALWILVAVFFVVVSIMIIIGAWSEGGFAAGLCFTPIALIFLLVGILMIVCPIEYCNKVEAHKETCIGADCTDDIHKEWQGSCGHNKGEANGTPYTYKIMISWRIWN